MHRPTITVAIPSYNKSGQIRRAIESVLANAEDIDRIILIDNCSTDDTFTIAEAYEPRIRCVRNERNLGMSGNFNRCIELCETEWLMIFHADDAMLPGAIKKYRSLIERHPTIGIVHADSCTVIGDDESTKVCASRGTEEFYPAGTAGLGCPYGVCSAVMVKNEAYDTLGKFVEESLSSDAEMWARIAGRYDVGSLSEPTVVYHVSNDSTGPQSLINRSIAEIKADWDDLNERTALAYPEGPARKAFQAHVRRTAPENYFAVVKANLRAHNWRNVIACLKLIIVDQRGLWPLIKIVSGMLRRKIIRSST